MTRIARAVATIAALVLGSGIANAQPYPSKPVRFINSSPAGGAVDVLARAYAQKLTEMWGQSVVIENRTGAAQMIGTEAVSKSAADGYTFLVTDSSPLVINPHLYAKLPYDPVKDFAPVAVLGKLSPVIAVNADLPAANLRELIALAKSRPLGYGSFGSGNYSHIAMENFRRLAAIDLVHVPYKGSPPAIIDLVAGRVQIVLATLSVFEAQERAGKIRVLAAATPARLAARPELPTVAEAGVPGAETGSWFGVLAPAGVSPQIVTKVHADILRVMQAPEFREQTFAKLSMEPVPVTPEQFRELLRADHERWGRLVKETGAKVD